MAVQMSVVWSGGTFTFENTNGVPIDRDVESGGGPIYVTRNRPVGPPTVWRQGRTLRRITLSGTFDVWEVPNGVNALDTLKDVWRAGIDVALARPRRPVIRNEDDAIIRWLIENIEEDPSDQEDSYPQTITYTITFMEMPE